MKILKDLVRWYDIILFPAAISIIGYSVYHTWYKILQRDGLIL